MHFKKQELKDFFIYYCFFSDEKILILMPNYNCMPSFNFQYFAVSEESHQENSIIS